MAANTTPNALCANGAQYQTNFNQYVTQCRNAADTRLADQFFSNSKAKYKTIFETLRAQTTDFLLTGDNLMAVSSLSGNSNTSVNSRLNELSKKKDLLTADIRKYRGLAEAADKTFLDDIMHGPPKKELAPSLQDASLLLFSVGWLFIAITLVAVRWGSPGGGWKNGLFALAIMLLVTMCVYALLKQVA